MEPFSPSKTDRMLLIGMAIGLSLVLLGIFVKVAFGESVIEFVLAGLGLSGSQGLLSLGRSLTDAPMRQQQNSLLVAKEASQTEAIPNELIPQILATSKNPTTVLPIWTPESKKEDTK